MEKCNFCNKEINSQKMDILLVINEDDNFAICENCAKEINSAIKKARASFVKKENINLKRVTPKNIKAELDKWIIGQELAKKRMSIATYDHYKRINQDMDDETIIQKSNILLVGSTGCGKTSIIKALAKQLKLPLHIQDVTTLSSAGYQGGNAEDILVNLLALADGDLELAEKGIVLLDEGDKLKKSSDSDSSRDVKGKGVQESLLKLTESGTYNVTYKNKSYVFNTENVLFVLAGVFDGIEKIIDKRMNKSNVSVGFNGTVKKVDNINYSEIILNILPEDLKKYGIMPELLGRFPIVTPLQDLTEEALTKILVEPKDAILKQARKLFNMDNVTLEWREQALKEIAKKALERKTGARALRGIVEEILENAKYQTPGSNIENIIINDDLSLMYFEKANQEREV